jgi:Ser/Thr protein kinase RdoA (MazF antagonist)
MTMERSGNAPPLEQRGTSLTQIAKLALNHYGFGDTKPVLLEDLTNVVYRIQPLRQRHQPSVRGVETMDNEGFVLRIHAPGQHSTRAIYEELQWLLAIRRDTSLIVPTPVPAPDGSLVQEIPVPGEPTPRQCVLFHWVPGIFQDETLTPQDVQRVGAFMAQLHCHAEQFITSRTPQPTRRALFCDVHTWLHTPRQVAIYYSSEELAVFAAAAQRVQTAICQLGEGKDVFGFIHADLHQWNYIFHHEEVCAIDFDDCGWGYYTYDMAVTLSYLEARPAFPTLQEAFLRGYQRVRPLPRSYPECLEVFLAARILLMVPWLLHLPQLSSVAWGPAYLQQAVGRLRRFLEQD